MGAIVAICKECGCKYNESKYQICPYCNGTGKMENKPGSHRGGLAWKWAKLKKTPNNESKESKPVTMVNNSEDSGYYNNVSANGQQPVEVHPTVGYYSMSSVIREEEEQQKEVTIEESNYGSEFESVEVPKQRKKNNKEPEESAKPLNHEIQKLGKTTAMYVNTATSDDIYPTVGWLLAVKGIYYGKSFPLRSGSNRVGRSGEYEVPLLAAENVSRQAKLEIIYDLYDKEFNALADNGAACVINEKRVFSNDRITLKRFDKITLGDKRENVFLFLPLCGDEFDWTQYPQD